MVGPESAQSFVFTINSYGDQIRWSRTSAVHFHINANNSSLGYSSTLNIFDQSAQSWNNTSLFSFSYSESSYNGVSGRNDVYFSKTNSTFTSTGVVAVTQIVFRESDGEILEADIVINDNYSFTSDELRSSFLGNAITHELGHVLGLGHGQVKGSSMFYELAVGQHTVDDDDKHGLKSLYKYSDQQGILKGQVVGNKNLVPILGAHVQLISRSKGKVIAGSITDKNGYFEFRNIPKDDEYFMYFGPAKALNTLNDYYRGARSDFCYGRSAYQGNFYKSCHSSQRGMPEVIKFNGATEIDVGPMTISCDLDVPSEYLYKKDLVYAPSLNFQQSSNFAHVGYFTKEEVLLSEPDDLQLDLSGIVLPAGSYFLELAIVSHQLYSSTKIDVTATRDGSSYTAPLLVSGVARDSDYAPNFNVLMRIPLSWSAPDKNIVNISLVPEDLLEYAEGYLAGFGPDEYFPSKELFIEPLYFYLLTATVVQQTSPGVYQNIHFNNGANKADSALCQGAPLAYQATVSSATKVNIPKSKESDTDQNPISCATIDPSALDGGNSGGPGGSFSLIFSLAIGLFLGLKKLRSDGRLAKF